MLNEARAILAALKADPVEYAVALPIYKALPKTFYKNLAFLLTEEAVEAAYRKSRELPDDEDLSDDPAYSTFAAMFYQQVGQDFIDKDIYSFFPEELVVDAAKWLSEKGLIVGNCSVIDCYSEYIGMLTKQDLKFGLAEIMMTKPVSFLRPRI